MADDMGNAGDAPEVALDLDDQSTDLEAAMRDAVAAVEGVESGSGRAGDPPAASDPPGSAGEIAKLRQENAELRDRSVRTLADFDNYRKRAERERQEQRRYALSEVLRDFLAIQDNLDLALTAGGSPDDVRRGVEMISRQLRDLLRRYGVEGVAA